jgi:hypothetical protein
MADTQAPNGKFAGADDPWREMRDNVLDAWAKTMVESVNSEAYAKVTGTMLDAYLSASYPFREALEKTMLQALQQLSMPSRADFVSLAERLTNLELRLDDMDAKLDGIAQALTSRVPQNAARQQAKKSPASKRKKR